MKREIKKILKEFENSEIALLQVLNYIQGKKGFVDDESIKEVSDILEISEDEIRSVISFYHFLHQEKTGKYRIYVCTNIPCLLKGADRLISDIKNFLDIEIGEATPDGLFSLFETECIGQCDNAPAIMINDKIYRNLSGEKIKKIIDGIKKNEKG